MEIKRERILPRNIEQEMRESYIDYSMSVIVSRALPDVRDGLKPVHRRVLYAMLDLGLRSNASYKKSARIVGEVLGKYHPHGDSAVYDTMVRMAQEFSLRYPLIDGQGNFGSVDGDSPAAMRYTEARLYRIAEETLRDIEKNTVDFVPNFDETLKEPTVLPSQLPNLLVNGSSGIAVGMATNIPPHNLCEVVDALVSLIRRPDLKVESLMKLVQGPDFPTGAIIYGDEGIDEAYRTGRGRITVRARANVETLRSGRSHVVVTEIPFQVNKANLLERIAELVRDKKVDGISDLRDESDRDGMRIVLELKREAHAEVVLNQLYRHTSMQTTFGVNMLALVDGRPEVLNLKQVLEHFIDFRHEVVVRRTKFDLEKAEARAHILEGYKIALDNIDEIVQLIKKSRSPESARQNLMKRFKLSQIQAQAILDMRLQRLTGLERKKIEEEYLAVIKLIAKLRGILESRAKRMEIIKNELLEVKEKYGDERRTEIVAKADDFSIEDMIAEEDMVITISHSGFIKRFPVSGYRRQMRGGLGVTGAPTREEDFLEQMFIASTHHYILFFTDNGRCYWLKVHEIPQGGRASKGRAIVNVIRLARGEKIAGFVTVRDFSSDAFIIMATHKGLVKKTALSDFSNPRRGGINAIGIRAGDKLIDAKLTDGTQEVILATSLGKAIRFKESDVREMGRTAAGVRGIMLEGDDYVLGMAIVRRQGALLSVSKNGYGKRTNTSDYRVTRRGGKGVLAMKVTEKTGPLVTMREVIDEDDLILITVQGMVVRIRAKDISATGRATQGVKLIRLKADDSMADIARIVTNAGNGNNNGNDKQDG